MINSVRIRKISPNKWIHTKRKENDFECLNAYEMHTTMCILYLSFDRIISMWCRASCVQIWGSKRIRICCIVHFLLDRFNKNWTDLDKNSIIIFWSFVGFFYDLFVLLCVYGIWSILHDAYQNNMVSTFAHQSFLEL